jgi:hypothetical protein
MINSCPQIEATAWHVHMSHHTTGINSYQHWTFRARNTRAANWFNWFQEKKSSNGRHKARERNQAVSHLSDLELVEHILQDLVILDHVHRHGTEMCRINQFARNHARRCLQTMKSTNGFQGLKTRTEPNCLARILHTDSRNLYCTTNTNHTDQVEGLRRALLTSTLERPSCSVVDPTK